MSPSTPRPTSGSTRDKHTRLVDGSTTLNAKPLPDGSGIVVLQDQEIYGSDNVVVLGSNG